MPQESIHNLKSHDCLISGLEKKKKNLSQGKGEAWRERQHIWSHCIISQTRRSFGYSNRRQWLSAYSLSRHYPSTWESFNLWCQGLHLEPSACQMCSLIIEPKTLFQQVTLSYLHVTPTQSSYFTQMHTWLVYLKFCHRHLNHLTYP